MTLHLKSRGYPFRPRLLFSSFIVVGVGSPTVYYFRRGQIGGFPPWRRKEISNKSPRRLFARALRALVMMFAEFSACGVGLGGLAFFQYLCRERK